jgi:hypothetical protein
MTSSADHTNCDLGNDDATVSTLGSLPPLIPPILPGAAPPPGFGPSVASVPETHPLPSASAPWTAPAVVNTDPVAIAVQSQPVVMPRSSALPQPVGPPLHAPYNGFNGIPMAQNGYHSAPMNQQHQQQTNGSQFHFGMHQSLPTTVSSPFALEPQSLFSQSNPMRSDSFDRILERSVAMPAQYQPMRSGSHVFPDAHTSTDSLELSLIESISTGESIIGGPHIWGSHSAPVVGSSLLGNVINRGSNSVRFDYSGNGLMAHPEHSESDSSLWDPQPSLQGSSHLNRPGSIW